MTNPAHKANDFHQVAGNKGERAMFQLQWKYNPSHLGKRLFLIEACSKEDNQEVDMEIEMGSEEVVPGISLHTISGALAPNIMQFQGQHKHMTPLVFGWF